MTIRKTIRFGFAVAVIAALGVLGYFQWQSKQ